MDNLETQQGNIGYTRRKTETNKTKTQHSMFCTPLYAENTNKVNMTNI